MKGNRLRDSPVTMVFVALAVRLAATAFLYPGVLNPRLDHWAFGYETGRIARAIASGRGFSDPVIGQTGPTAWLAPVYPYLVAGIFKLFGIFTTASALALLFIDSLFSALTCIPIFLIARKTFDRETAIWAGWIWAFFPFAVYFSASFIWDTCLAALLLTILFLIALWLVQPRSRWAWAGFGALWGAAALTDPAVLSVFPFLVGWLLVRLRRHQRGIARAALTLALALLVIAPWELRNYATFHRLLPVRDSLWLALRVGNTGDLTNHWSLDALPNANAAEMERYRTVGELNYMAEKRHEVLALIQARPGWFLWASLRRAIYFWTGFWSLPSRAAPLSFFDPDEPFDLSTLILSSLLTLLAAAGLWLAFRRRNPLAWPYLLVLLVYPFLYYLADPDVRYRHPIEPIMIVLASCAARTAYLRIRGRPEPPGDKGFLPQTP